MTPRPRNVSTKGGESGMVRTTLLLPEELWRQAKIRALDEGADLRTLLIRGLELILSQPMKTRGKGGA